MCATTNGACTWPGSDELMIEYHNTEWGVPLHDDRKIFEFMVLDAFQAGLTWKTILHKRKNFEKAFAGFDPNIVATFGDEEFANLMQDAGIVRNKLKILATINNARLFLQIQKEYGSFDAYIWQFVNHKPLVNQWNETNQIPAKTKESDAMSKDLLAKGFKFVGSTICYAFMQAAGMVNDHLTSCPRYKQVQKL